MLEYIRETCTLEPLFGGVFEGLLATYSPVHQPERCPILPSGACRPIYNAGVVIRTLDSSRTTKTLLPFMPMSARLVWLLALFAIAFASVGWLQWRSDVMAPKPLGMLDVEIPMAFGEWTGVATPIEDETVQVLRAKSHFNRSYRAATGASVLLHAANWENGNSISPAPHHPEVCYQAAGWKIIERRMVTCDYEEGAFPMELILFEAKGNRVVTAHWFQTGGVRYANDAQFSKERSRFLSSRKWPGTEKFLLQVSKATIDEAEPILNGFAKEILASRKTEPAAAS